MHLNIYMSKSLNFITFSYAQLYHNSIIITFITYQSLQKKKNNNNNNKKVFIDNQKSPIISHHLYNVKKAYRKIERLSLLIMLEVVENNVGT
jgi:hypothetical protein